MLRASIPWSFLSYTSFLGDKMAERVVKPTRSLQVIEIISISSLSNSKKKLSVARIVYFRKFRS